MAESGFYCAKHWRTKHSVALMHAHINKTLVKQYTVAGSFKTMAHPASPLSFPIDAVFTWVDGNDPHWLAKRSALLGTPALAPAAEALEQARFQDNQELRFALRSIAAYAPWVRTVHIITAGQTPTWLNTSAANLVFHEAIFPPHIPLPVFSNRPIELCAHRIPGLAEHFLYCNDDFMLGRPLCPNDFFTPEGTPRIWAVQRGKKTMQRLLQRYHENSHIMAVAASHKLVLEKFGKTLPITMRHFPKTMTISTAEAVWQAYPEAVENTLHSRFRATTDITMTMLYPLHTLLSGAGTLRPVNGLHQLLDAPRGIAHVGASLGDANVHKKMRAIRWLRPRTFCLNDSPGASQQDKDALTHFLTTYFPTPSPWEHKEIR